MKKVTALFLTLLLSGCLLQGTEVGNPMDENDGQGDCNGKRCMPSPMVSSQVSQICDKVVLCGSETFEACFDATRAQTGLDFYLGLGPEFDTFTQVELGYFDRKIDLDMVKSLQCFEALNAVTCQSSDFTSAYDVAVPTDYSAIHKLLNVNQSCTEMYSLRMTTQSK